MNLDNSTIDTSLDIILKLLEPIVPLGDKGSKFYLWKLDLIDILGSFKLPERIKKRLILSKISKRYYKTCHQLYYMESDLTTVQFLDEIEEILGFDQLSHKNIDLIKKIYMGGKSIEQYNQEFMDLVFEIKPEFRPPEKRLMKYYIKGFNEEYGEKFMRYIVNYKPEESLNSFMKFILKHKNAYNDIMNIEMKSEINKSNWIDSDVIEQNTILDELEDIGISEDDVKLYNLRFNSLLEKLNDDYRPDEQRLIYLYKKGIKENHVLFSYIKYTKANTVKELMEITLENYEFLDRVGAFDEKNNLQEEENNSEMSRNNSFRKEIHKNSRRGRRRRRKY
ncbi:hypothetical protein PIROE2DRAFT_63221 [Piromyces sp. E2]|nr:hypothetical protein PIROE2DRAFT_63221 [Piromyces sp. E2]|eukprot:OUM60328.1 hypothetical protein PIROE2DRAFT_63221 [Piromyces sp. E2]